MRKNLDDVSIETLKQRLTEEIEAQQRLHNELQRALEGERNLRLENDVLWVYLERKYPERVKDAESLLERLTQGNDLSVELQNRVHSATAKKRTLRQKVRHKLGTLPGVHQVYHGIKNIGK